MLLRLIIAAIFTISCANQACAGDFKLTVGGFYSESDSSMNVSNPETGNDFNLDFESDLALTETQFLPFFDLVYFINDKHKLYLDWKQLHRSADVAALSKPFQIEIDDVVYDVKAGGKLSTTLNIDIARIGYGYDFFQGSDYDIGVSIGLHVMFINTGFEGVIGACASSEISNDICSSTPIPRVVDEKVTAPLPDIGLYGNYEFSPNWRFSAHAQYFYVKIDDIKGALTDVRAGIDADISENWRMSIAYNYYKVDVDISQTPSESSTRVADYNLYYNFVGPMLSVSYSF